MIGYETSHPHPHRDLPRYKALEMPPPANDGGEAQARAQRQLAMLAELSDMAMDLARSAYRRVKAQEATLDEVAEDAEDSEGRRAGDAPAARAEAGGEGRAGAGIAPSIEDQITGLRGGLTAAASGAGARDGVPARGDPSLVFARLARVVFQAVALDRRIAEDQAAAEAEAGPDPYHDPEMTPERKARIMARWQLLLSRKNAVVRVVKAAIAAEHPWEDAEECGRQLNDRLLEFERFEVLNRTIWDNVLRHTQPLGLHPKREDWAHETWAEAEKDGALEWDHNPYRSGGP